MIHFRMWPRIFNVKFRNRPFLCMIHWLNNDDFRWVCEFYCSGTYSTQNELLDHDGRKYVFKRYDWLVSYFFWSAHTRCAPQGLGPAPGGIHATFWLTAVRHSQRVRLHDPFDCPFRRTPRTKRTKLNLRSITIGHRLDSDAESSV